LKFIFILFELAAVHVISAPAVTNQSKNVPNSKFYNQKKCSLAALKILSNRFFFIQYFVEVQDGLRQFHTLLGTVS